ncbi:MAG: pitrilysin family protein [Paludibacteraceae bacterium]|nr:pitrilysin family protein [Paludibacteraceae bacterium]
MNQTFYHNLPNGVRIVHRQTSSAVAYVGVMVGTGTRDEQPEESGMAHYIEHCVFKGTANHSARQIINSIEGIGGEINAYTTKEETTFYAATLTEHIARTLHLIAEMVLCPTFPKAETDKERTVIYDEIEGYNDSPSELIYDDFENLVFCGHPLAMPILGTKKSLRHISATPTRPLLWMASHYRPERMVVFCQGNLSPERVFRLAEKEFGAVSPVVDTNPRIAPKSIPVAETSFRKHTHQTHVMLGNRAYPLGDERQLTLYLLNNILGGGSLNSRLNLSLRESRGLVYSIESTYTPLSDTGYWCVYFACEPEYFERCLDLTKQELAHLCSKPLSDSTLRNALVQLRGQMAISAENQENNALSMAKSVLYHNVAPTWEETFARVSQTTPADLLSAAQDVLSPDTLFLLTYC